MQPRRLSQRWITILFIVNTAGLISYYIFDFAFDSKFDMLTPAALILLVLIYSIGFMYWRLATRSYNYIR